MASILLSDLVDEFEASMRSNSYSKNTIRANMTTARAFLAHVGNIQVRNVTDRHVDKFFSEREAKNIAPTTLNLNLTSLRALFRFAARRRYLAAGTDPTAHRRKARVIKRDRQRVPAHHFGRLLDCAANPRDRIVIALGLYLFLRASEIRPLRFRDVDLDDGRLNVTIVKSSLRDSMPISAELDRELRRWLTFYASHLGRPLRPDDYLVPARERPAFIPGVGPRDNAALSRERFVLNPQRPYGHPELAVQTALVAYGMDIADDNGKSLGEGVHTLRRSGARALFDSKVQEGYDGALRLVQSMLHHSSSRTTEIYLGIHLDKKRRDDEIRGKEMFHFDTANVIPLEKAVSV